MKTAFLTSLDVRCLGNKEWALLAPFVVVVKGKLIRVPLGFVTDFASVPRIPLAFTLFGGIGDRAATVHDWLYSTGEVSRQEADEILKTLLVAEGAGGLRASLMYAGVRVGGGAHYKPSSTASSPTDS